MAWLPLPPRSAEKEGESLGRLSAGSKTPPFRPCLIRRQGPRAPYLLLCIAAFVDPIPASPKPAREGQYLSPLENSREEPITIKAAGKRPQNIPTHQRRNINAFAESTPLPKPLQQAGNGNTLDRKRLR